MQRSIRNLSKTKESRVDIDKVAFDMGMIFRHASFVLYKAFEKPGWMWTELDECIFRRKHGVIGRDNRDFYSNLDQFRRREISLKVFQKALIGQARRETLYSENPRPHLCLLA